MLLVYTGHLDLTRIWTLISIYYIYSLHIYSTLTRTNPFPSLPMDTLG